MLFVFNKNKIISYLVATSIVIVLFVFSVSVIPNSDTKIVQVSSNSIENNKDGNNINKNINSKKYENNIINDKIIMETIEK